MKVLSWIVLLVRSVHNQRTFNAIKYEYTSARFLNVILGTNSTPLINTTFFPIAILILISIPVRLLDILCYCKKKHRLGYGRNYCYWTFNEHKSINFCVLIIHKNSNLLFKNKKKLGGGGMEVMNFDLY